MEGFAFLSLNFNFLKDVNQSTGPTDKADGFSDFIDEIFSNCEVFNPDPVKKN